MNGKSSHQDLLNHIEYLKCYIQEQETIGAQYFGGEYAIACLKQELEECLLLLAAYND